MNWKCPDLLWAGGRHLGQHPGGHGDAALVDREGRLVDVRGTSGRACGRRAGPSRPAPAGGTRRSPHRPATARCWPRAARPSTRSAARVSRSIPSGWLTAGRHPGGTSTSTSTPNGRTMSATSSGISCLARPPAGDVERAQGAHDRRRRRGWRWPPSRRGSGPTSATRPLRGSTRRDSTAGSRWPACRGRRRGPAVRCGREVWPPMPVRATSTWSTRRGDGPDLAAPIWPTSVRGSQCSAKISVTSVAAPRRRSRPARRPGWPPRRAGRSAGRRGAAGPRRAAGPAPARRRAGPRCARRGRRRGRPRGDCERYGTFLASVIGSASMSARKPTRPSGVAETVGQDVAVRAGADRQDLGHQAGPLQLVDDQLRWCGARRCRPRDGRGGRAGDRSVGSRAGRPAPRWCAAARCLSPAPA